ncbi:branched-chain amino acid ABC transporter permease [Nonomuraea glycinis]|uniref:Branched-chain amino acid ABC transporter permease n=1 Tax=Nonomuraea glycinis TaxID=2047744 RepID=A0A918A7Y6_9ACTN|nr:branched-chain amino acid ABC transporter permease [Nonomuraea glycinis]MCA2176486.1 branched-chain amino acid ABC transporter permease [Nonomuraea glycinis]GGP07066.1 branched-chain amino acid ABC transporter permease [Nonomuraea glycinis]
MSAFLSYLLNGLAVGCAIALIASGLVVIHRVTGVVNFAQGTFAVVAGLCASSLLGMGLPHGLSEVAAVLAGAVAGLLTGLAAIGRRGTSPLSALIVTLGVGVLAYAVEIVLWGDQPRSAPGLAGSVTIAGARIQTQHLLVICVTAATFVLIALFFGRTYLGKALTACASNPYAARVVGIDTRRMGLLAFAIGGLLGGLAGVLITPLRPISFDTDVTLIVNGFAAAVFGALTRPVITLIGALLLGVAETMAAGYGYGSHQLEVALGLMILVMIVQASRRSTIHEETV